MDRAPGAQLKAPLSILLQNLGPLRGQVALLLAIGSADGVLTFLIPVFTSAILEQATADPIAPLRPVLWIGTTFLASIGLQWFIRRKGETLGPEFGLRLRERCCDDLLTGSPHRLFKHHSGFLHSMVAGFADGFGGFIGELIWGVTRTAVHLARLLSRHVSRRAADCNA